MANDVQKPDWLKKANFTINILGILLLNGLLGLGLYQSTHNASLAMVITLIGVISSVVIYEMGTEKAGKIVANLFFAAVFLILGIALLYSFHNLIHYILTNNVGLSFTVAVLIEVVAYTLIAVVSGLNLYYSNPEL